MSDGAGSPGPSTNRQLERAVDACRPLLRRLVAERVFPGAALAVACSGAPDCVVGTTGALTYDPGSSSVTTETRYDLASVTKVVAACAVTMTLVADETLSLATPLSAVVPDWGGGAKDEVTVGHLLSHTSGLAAHEPFYLDRSGAEAVRRAVKASSLLAPPGSRCVYDLRIILLVEVLEAATNSNFATLVGARMLEPLALHETSFAPPAALRPSIAPTEDDSWRGTVVHGVVHDENAYAMDGIAPHAGLFSTAADVARIRSKPAGRCCSPSRG